MTTAQASAAPAAPSAMVTEAVVTKAAEPAPAQAPTQAPAAAAKEPTVQDPAKAADEAPAENYTEKLMAAIRGEDPPAQPGEIELKAPEGAPEHVVGLVRDVAKMAKIPQETAQKALELVHQNLLQQQAQFVKAQVEATAKEIWNHPELGGSKARVQKTMADSREFISRFVAPEHAERLIEKHVELPAFLHVAFATAHQRISPDTFVPGTPGPAKAGSDSDGKAIFAKSLQGKT